MPVESSIYWDSIDSQRSTSGGSSGDVCSSGSSSRHYVDPWDLENYAYLRRHSVAGLAQPQPRQRRRTKHRSSHDARAQSEYWCASSLREPGYDAPAFVEELYYGPARQANNACYYHQPIYEDEVPDYVAPFPVCTPPSDFQHGEMIENPSQARHKCKSSSMRERQRLEHFDPRTHYCDSRAAGSPQFHAEQEYRSMPVNPAEERYFMEVIPPPHLDLNTYGHLKIDYTNSWNSLKRKISK